MFDRMESWINNRDPDTRANTLDALTKVTKQLFSIRACVYLTCLADCRRAYEREDTTAKALTAL